MSTSTQDDVQYRDLLALTRDIIQLRIRLMTGSPTEQDLSDYRLLIDVHQTIIENRTPCIPEQVATNQPPPLPDGL